MVKIGNVTFKTSILLVCFAFIILGCTGYKQQEANLSMSASNFGSTNTNKWPSADLSKIRYNAQEENGIELYEELYGESSNEDPYSYFYSIPKPMLANIEYEIDIEDSITEYVEEYLTSKKYEFTNEFLEDNFSINEETFTFNGSYMGLIEPIDRTINVELRDESMYTLEFVRLLQKYLIVEYPLWRIHVYATYIDGGESLTIYPELIVAGDIQSQPDNFVEVLAAWRQRIFYAQEKTRGPRRRQLRVVKGKIRDAFKQLKIQLDQKNKPFVLIEAFDNWQGHYKTTSVWALIATTKKMFLSLESSSTDLNCGSGEELNITPESELTNEICKHNINSQQYHINLKQFTFDTIPLCKRYDLTVVEKQYATVNPEPTGNRWDFQLDVKDIITDDSLKVMESDENE